MFFVGRNRWKLSGGDQNIWLPQKNPENCRENMNNEHIIKLQTNTQTNRSICGQALRTDVEASEEALQDEFPIDFMAAFKFHVGVEQSICCSQGLKT